MIDPIITPTEAPNKIPSINKACPPVVGLMKIPIIAPKVAVKTIVVKLIILIIPVLLLNIHL